MANAGKGATGALSGAATGATLGSVVPGIGTAIGAIGGGLIGGISGLFSGGDDYQAIQAEVQNPVTLDQTNAAYGNSQQALLQQQAFLQALQAQGGLQNQSNVFNQLQGVANGTGPNPAQAMLAQNTGNNIAAQTAMMAGQRGASANTGLMARQAAMQGTNALQQGAGQASVLQANQSLGALGQMGNIAGQQVANQAQATGAANQFSQNQQQLLLNSMAQQNQAAIQNASQYNSSMAGTDANRQKSGDLLGSAGASIAALAPMLGGGGSSGSTGATGGGSTGNSSSTSAYGGLGGNYSFYAQGGEVEAAPTAHGPRSRVAMHLKGIKMNGGGDVTMQQGSGQAVPVVLSPGEKVLSPTQAKAVAEGANPSSLGKMVPGKAAKPGVNDPANDTVPAKAAAGSIVIPLSVLNSDDPIKGTIAFVRAHMSSQQKKKAP